jgi:DNA-binding CsgD family transcriptional regulator/tetratricopeptide (TPR) repeat protein
MPGVADRPAGVAGPFVGRARELAVAAEVISDTERTGVALIGGEAGLGKTRLIGEIIAAHPESMIVRGGAVPRTTPQPFELIRTVVEPIARASTDEPADLDAVTDAAFAMLSDRHLDKPFDKPGVERRPSTSEQVLAAAEVLRGLHTGPTIFVFEDVHWADPESLDVIDRLMVAGPLAATVLVSYRPEALRPRHPINAFLQRAERRAHAVQLRLEPLRRNELAQYLVETGHHIDDRTIEHVHSRTGGNPLFLSELVGSAENNQDLTGSLPWTLAEIIRPEIERLPAAERLVVEAVAVLGTGADFDLVAAAVAVEERELLTRLRRLVDTGILVESGPDRFGFRHDLVREAVADGLFTRERRRIHAAAHDALLAAGSDDEVALVTHASAAGRTKQAADAARDAAVRSLERGSSHQAMSFAEQALLVHSDDLGLLRIAVTAGWLTSQLRAALDHVNRWDDLVGAEPTGRAEVLHWRVRLLWESGNLVAANDAAAELSELVELIDRGPAQARALADLAQHLMLSGDHEAAIVAADRAVIIATEADAPEMVLQARAERASAMLAMVGQRADALAELAAVAADAEAASEFVVATRALNNMPVLATGPEPRRHLERMRNASQRAGLTCVATTGYRLALLLVAEAEGVRSEFEAVLELALTDLEDVPALLVAAIVFQLDAGRPDEARALADRLSDLSDSGHFHQADRVGVRALVDFIADGSTAQLTAWLDDEETTGLHPHLILANLSELIDAGLGPSISRVLEKVAGGEVAGCCYDGAVEGVLAELRDDHETADRVYAEVLASPEGGAATMLAELELGRARVSRAQGLDADPFIQAAANRLVHWPGRLRDRIEDSLGERCADATTSGVLTPRERQVAELVSRGLTNGGIADELFISTKTASVHVSNILSKLAMTSRVEIAAWVAAGGLD